MSAKSQPRPQAATPDWLEMLPMAALVVDGACRIRQANSAAQKLAGSLQDITLAQMLGEAHPLVRAIAEAARGERTARLDEFPWPPELGPVEPATGWVMTLNSGEALLLLDFAHAKDTASNYTQISATMAAMLAHEVRNPLLAIKGAAQLLAGNANADDFSLTELIVREVGRIDQLIATLDPLSDAPKRVMAPFNIHEALEHARQSTAAAFPGVMLEDDYDPSLPPVVGEKDALVQVILNLLKNAAEAIEETPAPTITLTSRYALGETRRNAAGKSLRVAISVADNGPGIAPEVADRLFAPFTTTKSGGRGLGLAIVARIVEEHGGLILLDTPVSGGTRFTLYLPTA